MNNKSTLLKLLPPTEDVFFLHLRRVVLVTVIDKSGHVYKHITSPYEQYGWVLDNSKLIPVASTQPACPQQMTETIMLWMYQRMQQELFVYVYYLVCSAIMEENLKFDPSYGHGREMVVYDLPDLVMTRHSLRPVNSLKVKYVINVFINGGYVNQCFSITYKYAKIKWKHVVKQVEFGQFPTFCSTFVFWYICLFKYCGFQLVLPHGEVDSLYKLI